jgi:hypothetical protein
MTIELSLDKEDAAVLEHVLEAYLAELRFEIGGTDSFDFRSRLHEQESRLNRMLAILNGAGPGNELPRPAER